MGSIPFLQLKRSTLLIASAVALAGCATDRAMMADVKPVYRIEHDTKEAVYRALLENGAKYFAEGKYGLALAAFESVRRHYPRSVSALNGLGACYDKLGRFDLAQASYHEALSIEPGSAKVLNNLGYSLALQGRVEEARAVYRLALKSDPDNALTKRNLAQVEARLPVSVAAADPAVSRSGRKDADLVAPASAGLPTTTPIVSEAPSVPDSGSGTVESGRSATGAARARPVVETADVSGEEPASTVAATTMKTSAVAVVHAAVATAPASGADRPVAVVASVAPGMQARRVAPLLGPVNVTQGLPAVAGIQLADASAAEVQASVNAGVEGVPVAAHRTEVASEAGDKAQSSVAAPAIAIANGNGRRGFARLVSRYFESLGESVAFVVNARSFTHEQTQIAYPNRAEGVAERLANSLPVKPILERVAVSGDDQVRVVLGQDLLAYENGIRLAVSFPKKSTIAANGSSVPLEISNGNGRNGMAKRMSAWLRGQGSQVVRITNADSFAYEKSVIYYSSDRREDAQAFASRLPVKPVMSETQANERGVALRLVIGRDLLSFERALQETDDTNA
jgi:hypothetical protein